MWSPDLVMARWKNSVDLFSRIFLADGPGAERDSFLAARAGVAGRLARYSGDQHQICPNNIIAKSNVQVKRMSGTISSAKISCCLEKFSQTVQ